jgi:hypothetical protein
MIDILAAGFCHSGLSGILLQYRVAVVICKKDSGQAGMTTRGFANVLINKYCISRQSSE